MRSMASQRRALLRPMTTSEFTDACFIAYRTIGWSVLKATMVPSVFIVAAIVFVVQFVFPSFFVTSNAGNIQLEVTEALFTLFIGFAVGLPLVLIGLSVSTSIIVYAASEFVVGNLSDIRFAIANARKRWFGILLLQLRQLLLGFSGLVFSALLLLASGTFGIRGGDAQSASSGVMAFIAVVGIILGFLLAVFVFGWGALVIPAYLMEGGSVREASRRGYDLMRGSGPIPGGIGFIWQLIGVVMLYVILLSAGIGTAIGLIGSFESGGSPFKDIPYGEFIEAAFTYVPLFLSVWVLSPLWGIGATVLYYERRVRKEGYDVEILAQDIWKRTPGSRFQI
jgi:hypothetical protein